MKVAFTRKVVKVGDGYFIRIPKHIVNFLNIDEHTMLSIEIVILGRVDNDRGIQGTTEEDDVPPT